MLNGRAPYCNLILYILSIEKIVFIKRFFIKSLMYAFISKFYLLSPIISAWLSNVHTVIYECLTESVIIYIQGTEEYSRYPEAVLRIDLPLKSIICRDMRREQTWREP